MQGIHGILFTKITKKQPALQEEDRLFRILFTTTSYFIYQKKKLTRPKSVWFLSLFSSCLPWK